MTVHENYGGSSDDATLGMSHAALQVETRPYVDTLLADIQMSEDESLIFPESSTIENRRRLRAVGHEAATVILDDLERHGDLYQPELLLYCASQEDAARIGNLLVDPERESRPLLNALRYFGTTDNVEQVSGLAEASLANLERRAYEEELDDEAVSALNGSLDVLFAVQNRVKDAAEVRRLNGLIAPLVLRSVKWLEQSPEFMHAATLPSVLDEQYQSLFEVGPDNDGADEEEYPDDTEDAYWDDSKQIREHLDLNALPATATADERVAVLHRLRGLDTASAEPSLPSRSREHRFARFAFLEGLPQSLAPSLGIEIEVFTRTMLPPEAAQWTAQARAEFLRQKRRLFRETYYAGVPFGGDAEWEFANAPARYYPILTHEVGELVRLGLINPEFRHNPLHLTVEGVTTEGEHGREAYLLARSLEATGWPVDRDRLLQPEKSGGDGWLRNGKGEEGVKERRLGEMQLGATRGIEIRTFQFQGLLNLERTLRSAYYLGAALKAYQVEGEKTETQERLAAIWADFSGKAGALFEEYGMADPRTKPDEAPDQTGSENPGWMTKVTYRQSPRPDGATDYGVVPKGDRLGQSWHTLANLLGTSNTDEDSRGPMFMSAMQRLVTDVRKGVREVIGVTVSGQEMERTLQLGG